MYKTRKQNPKQSTLIPLNRPEFFHLYLVIFDKNSLDHLHLETFNSDRAEVRYLEDLEIDRLLSVLEFCNLSQAEVELLLRAQAVISVSTKVRNQNLFESFNLCQNLAQRLGKEIPCTTVVFDLIQGKLLSNSEEDTDTPLVKDVLTIKAYQADPEEENFFLCTEGLIRFGLPELILPEIPKNLGSDGAYFLRSVAQYLLTRIDKVSNTESYLRVKSSIPVPACFCEFNNPYFQDMDDTLVPLHFEPSQIDSKVMLITEPKEEYDDYYDWLMSEIDSLNQVRTKAHWREESHALQAG